MADLPIRKLTEKELKDKEDEKRIINEINNMSHYEMGRVYRFSTRTEFFDSSKPYWAIFKERFYTHFGGWNPALSKQVGWDH